MKHGSLFTGIGGFDLVAEWMGWDNIFHCEWNEFGQKILKYYWPNAISYGDITKTDFTKHRGTIDILTGGFPCQPYSLAGERKGTEDDRHLWPEMLRAIREIQPRWIVGENVPGLVNWSKGLVFEQVQADLEAEGYEVFPFILPAVGVDAPHKRDRVWIIAYNSSKSIEQKVRRERGEYSKERTEMGQINTANGKLKITTDTRLQRPEISEKQTAGIEQCDKGIITNPDSSIGCERGMYKTEQKKAERYISAFDTRQNGRTWENFPTQPPICSRDDGFSAQLDGITFPKWRNESIKGYGNAIVPQVAFQIFKAIQDYDSKK